MSARHTILIAEDDDGVAAVLEEICASLGFATRRAKTLAEVIAAIEEGGYCGVLLDLQLPADASSRPLVGSGETALGALRKRDSRRNPATDCHELPIIAVTGYSTLPEFVARLFKAGVDEFIPKSFDDGSGKSFAERLDAVLDVIRGTLARAGRADHAACAALAAARGAASAPALPQVMVELRGETAGARSVVLVNGKPRELQRQKFLVFLRLALEHRRDPDAWLTHHDLGIAKAPDVTKRIRDALNPAMPEGLDVLETKYGDGKCRLLRSVIVHVDDAALAQHEDEDVRKLVADRGKAPKKRRGGT